MAWLNLPGSGMANAPGIRPLRFLRVDGRQPLSKLPAVVVLVTKTAVGSGSYNPWDDEIDLVAGLVRYWGDAKLDAKRNWFLDFTGNRVLRRVWQAITDGRRADVPPILHFRKAQSGYVTFTGLCSLESLEVDQHLESGQPVDNYHCTLRILGDDSVSVDWLADRRRASTTEGALKSAPDAWLAWIGGSNERTTTPGLGLMGLDRQAEQLREHGQGFNGDPEARRAVEKYAMNQARDWLKRQGWTDDNITDVSRMRPYDLHAEQGARRCYLEVKGTQTSGNSVFVTRNEVEFARANKDDMALFVVHSIEVRRGAEGLVAAGGVARVVARWDPDAGGLSPVTFSYAIGR